MLEQDTAFCLADRRGEASRALAYGGVLSCVMAQCVEPVSTLGLSELLPASAARALFASLGLDDMSGTGVRLLLLLSDAPSEQGEMYLHVALNSCGSIVRSSYIGTASEDHGAVASMYASDGTHVV